MRLPKKAQALLAYLGVRSGQSHHREQLAGLLWGDKSDEQARDALRHALAALRRALGKASSRLVHVEGQTLALDGERVEVDVATLERLLTDKAPAGLESAAALYRGDLLLGFNLNEPSFDEWLVAERERLREMVVNGLTRLLADQMRATTTERAIQTALRLLALDHLQEGVHRALMRLYARQGRRGAALKQYQICVSALRRELGTEPEAETRRLYQELLRHHGETSDPAGPERARAPSVTGSVAVPDLPAAETPLFGREVEHQLLRRLLDDAFDGHGHIATVVGEAGIGKTRLVSALAGDAVAMGGRVLVGRCHESDSILPFGPWVDAFRRDGVATDKDVFAALHPSRHAELLRLLPEAAVADLPLASGSALALFEAVAALVEALAARQPLIVVIEDLHWADEMSLRLLAFVSRRLAAWRLFVVATARDDELTDAPMPRQTLHQLSRASAAMSIALPPLSRQDTGLLVRALGRVGGGSSPSVEEQIWAMSEGNPFVAVEAMRAFEQSSADSPRGAAVLPPTVRDLVARRLERLSPRAQQLAAVAAVIGRQFDFALLHAAGGVEEEQAAEALEEMVRQRVVQAVGPQLDFTHERIRSVAYDRLLAPRRQLLHRAVAAALEAEGDSERIEQLAYHALRGDLGEKAARYVRLAGAKAAMRSAVQDARTWFRQALGVLETLPTSRAVLEETFEVRVALRVVLTQLCEFRLALEELRAADALAQKLDDEHRRGRVRAFMANVHARLGEPDEALVLAREALEIGERLGDGRLRRLATTFVAQAHQIRGEFAAAAEVARRNVTAPPAEWTHEIFGGSPTVAVTDHGWLVMSLTHLGRFAEAARYEADMIRIAEATGHPYTIAHAYTCASTLHIVRGDWRTALDRLDRLLAVLRTSDIVDQLAHALAHSARALAHFGDRDEAWRRIREVERLLDDRAEGGVGNTGWVHLALGRAYLALDRIVDAHRHAERAASMSSRRTDSLPSALHLLGDVASLREDDTHNAEAFYRRALSFAQARGMRPLVGNCHFGLGRLRRGAGYPTEAREHLATAAATYRELGMDDGVAEAEAASIEL